MDTKYNKEIREFAENDTTGSYKKKDEIINHAEKNEAGAYNKSGKLKYKAFYNLNH